ncbi:MAG: Asp23/Gls24 family envelope stress response protein [Eubacterium sp.]|nr:Asp23/Gls24 family envelope stress response protein [Eubacterium sp.]
MTESIEQSGPAVYTEEEILRKVAGIVSGIDGVAGLSSNLPVNIPMIGGKVRGVRMSDNGTDTEFDIYVDVEYGVRIPQLAWDIQSAVTKFLSSEFDMTATVNINVRNVISVRENNRGIK